MLLHCGLLLLFLNCVRSAEDVYDYGLENSGTEYDLRFSYWPSVHNGAAMMRLRKREVQSNPALSEGGGAVEVKQPVVPTSQPAVAPPQPAMPFVPVLEPSKVEKIAESQEPPKAPVANDTATVSPTVHNDTNTNTSATESMVPNKLALDNPGVLKRAFIVFGGFLLLAVAYFIFYRRKSNKNDTSNAHSTIDANQFRYGVLQSEDRRDNLELSRIPLTMESDDEDDEDLEIFDLEQKKKSLSYVNLQTNDEDIVFEIPQENRQSRERDNLLLDIEGGSDTLINWSNNGNKSIL